MFTYLFGIIDDLASSYGEQVLKMCVFLLHGTNLQFIYPVCYFAHFAGVLLKSFGFNPAGLQIIQKKEQQH